ncbi:hypothetical protein SA6_12195, partial [Staphylococcus epidermidis]
AAATQGARCLGVGDDHCRWRPTVIRKGQPALCFKLEAVLVPVVADGSHRRIPVDALVLI